MKASNAKLLVIKAKELKDTLDKELSFIYSEIERLALQGIIAYHYQKRWLSSDCADYKWLEQSIVDSLIENGYKVERKYYNPNQPWLLISWG